jgi:hypothetical protein
MIPLFPSMLNIFNFISKVQFILDNTCITSKLNKEPRPQGGALKPKFSKPKNQIPNQVRDDKTQEENPVVMLNLGLMEIRLVSDSD